MHTHRIKEISADLCSKTVGLRRKLHSNPELGFREHHTSSLISSCLHELGHSVRTGIAGTGVTGLLTGSRPGKTIAIRADMDALSVTELNEFDYASRNKGIMHACGHDMHMAIVLGTAGILTRMREELNGSVLFLFQPGEEGLGGAQKMILEGVLDTPPADAILACHVWPELETGRISVCPGPAMATPSEFEIIIKGKGGHAAAPHNTIDPVLIGTNLVSLLQGIITRERDPLKSALLSVTTFHAGSAYNIIPDTAVLRGTVRTFHPELDRFIAGRMEQITASLTGTMGAGYTFNYHTGYPPVINDPGMADKLVESAASILPRDGINPREEPSMLAEDFSYYARKIPGVLFNLGCRRPSGEETGNLHSARFNPDEDCICIGMGIMAQFALDFLDESAKR